jgi:cyclomaltodextrinase / maltogenic alpha-amylase / neopullulanase
MHSNKTPEFIFGTLSTSEGRIKRARSGKLGFQHDAILQPRDPRPEEPVTITARAGIGVALRAARLHYTTDGTLPNARSHANNGSTILLPMKCKGMEWDTQVWDYIEIWSTTIPPQAQTTCIRYLITATTDENEEIACPFINLKAPELRIEPDAFDWRYIHRLLRSRPPQVYEFFVDTLTAPHWLQTAVIYQVFVDRFAPDPYREFSRPQELAGFLGGTIKGIISRLDYMSDLGITCLWLTPIFPSPSYHGYDPTDYSTIEPRLGSDADFYELVDAAHQRGIRIVLDFVANHISRDHPAFIAAQQNLKNPFSDWFFFHSHPTSYECFFDIPDQPIINADHAQVRDYFIQAAGRWLKAGCDGFRLDHAHGVTHAFWSAFRAATRSVKPESAMFGEITDTPAVMRSFEGRMDGILDFHLLGLLRDFFAFQTLKPSEFDRGLKKHFEYFERSLILISFLDNHDMNRFLWIVNGDRRRLMLAALCQFTLPGTPIIYYGTESGLCQIRAVGRLEEARLPMNWETQDHGLQSFYQRLIGLRRQTSDKWSLPRQTILADDRYGIYIYRCGEYITALNNSEDANRIVLPADRKVEVVLATDEGIAPLTANQFDLPPFAGILCKIV